VTTATGTQLAFYTPDRVTPYHLQQVSYLLSGGQLSRAYATSTNTNGPPWTIPALGTYVTRLGSIVNTTAFAYKDANRAATTDKTKVASVTVTLTVQPGRGLGGASSTHQATIDLRTPTCES
jgi:hypothetical protein